MVIKHVVNNAALEPQSNRCFNCSAMGHTKRDCPVKNGAETNKDPKNKVAKTSKSKGKGSFDGTGKGKIEGRQTKRQAC